MSHFSALVFTEMDIESKLERFHCDCEYNREFEEAMTIKKAKREYKEFMLNTDNFRNDLQKLLQYKKGGYLEFHKEENNYNIEDGKVGYLYNPDGIYDWYEVGGRWRGCLPIKTDKVSKEEIESFRYGIGGEKYEENKVDFAPIQLIDVKTLLKESGNFWNIINIYDEYLDLNTNKKERNKLIKESFKSAMELYKEGEQVYVYVVDFHS